MLTQARLKELLHYNPETGIFTWLVSTSNRAPAGYAAGSITHGYVIITVDRRHYRAHQLAWLYVHGQFPSGLIDHINCDRADNRIQNLRAADHSLNARNRGVGKNSKCGVRGVHWSAQKRKWRAVITVNYQNIHLGLFDDLEAAKAARKVAEKEHFQCAF